MYSKIASLKNLVNMGLNVHEYCIPESQSEFLDCLCKFQFCTIRTDHAEQSQNLPFYVFDLNKDGIKKGYDIWAESCVCNYKLIVANGIKYDNIQIYNMATKLNANGDFIFEASDLKVPLRHMYRYPLLSCSGNISDKIHNWDIYNQLYGLNKSNIKKDLEELYCHNIFNKWLEVTKYPITVGTQNRDIIFWQIV